MAPTARNIFVIDDSPSNARGRGLPGTRVPRREGERERRERKGKERERVTQYVINLNYLTAAAAGLHVVIFCQMVIPLSFAPLLRR